MSLAAVCGHSMSRLLLEPAPSVVNILHNNLHCSSVQVQCARLLGAQCCEYFAQAPQSPGPGPGILHTTPSSHHCFLALVNQIVLIEIWKFANRQYNFRTAISEQSWEHLGFLSPHLRTGSQQSPFFLQVSTKFRENVHNIRRRAVNIRMHINKDHPCFEDLIKPNRLQMIM